MGPMDGPGAELVPPPPLPMGASAQDRSRLAWQVQQTVPEVGSVLEANDSEASSATRLRGADRSLPPGSVADSRASGQQQQQQRRGSRRRRRRGAESRSRVPEPEVGSGEADPDASSSGGTHADGDRRSRGGGDKLEDEDGVVLSKEEGERDRLGAQGIASGRADRPESPNSDSESFRSMSSGDVGLLRVGAGVGASAGAGGDSGPGSRGGSGLGERGGEPLGSDSASIPVASGDDTGPTSTPTSNDGSSSPSASGSGSGSDQGTMDLTRHLSAGSSASQARRVVGAHAGGDRAASASRSGSDGGSSSSSGANAAAPARIQGTSAGKRASSPLGRVRGAAAEPAMEEREASRLRGAQQVPLCLASLAVDDGADDSGTVGWQVDHRGGFVAGSAVHRMVARAAELDDPLAADLSALPTSGDNGVTSAAADAMQRLAGLASALAGDDEVFADCLADAAAG